jgi:hypothetical protein
MTGEHTLEDALRVRQLAWIAQGLASLSGEDRRTWSREATGDGDQWNRRGIGPAMTFAIAVCSK